MRSGRSKMEKYKRKVIEDLNQSHPFSIGDMVSNLVDRNIFEPREISGFKEPVTISTLIDKIQEKEDDVFDIIIETLESTKYPEELINTLRERAETEAERSRKIEAATVTYSFSTDPSKREPLIFLDTMSQVAESLEDADIRLLCDHFNILRGEREKINKSKRPGLDVVFLLRQRLFVSSHDVKEMHKVLKHTKSGQILLQYMEMLTYPEMSLTGTWENRKADTMEKDPPTMFKLFRRLKCFFERETQTVLFHISEERSHLTMKIPNLKALDDLVAITNSKLVTEKVSSLFSHHRQSNEVTFRLKINESDLNRVRTILGRKCSFNAVPLCVPTNCIWDSHRKTLSVDHRIRSETLQICKEGFELLKSIGNEMIVVVCITGSTKSGKSFFASQLQKGVLFESHHVLSAHTTGIWIGVGETPIRVGEDTARVVILDVQGLGAQKEEDTDGTTLQYKMSALCLMLSSYFIYTTKGPPNCEDLYKLGCITDFSHSFVDGFQEKGEYLEDARQCSPDCLWLFQDNLYKPALVNGETCSWTKYAKVALLAHQEKETELNGIRKSITSAFNSIRAADLPPPTYDAHAITDLLADKYKDKINQNFLHRLVLESKQILSVAQVKKIRGRPVTGHIFGETLKDFVSAVNSSKLKVTRVRDLVADIHLERCKRVVLGEYAKQMEQIDLPNDEEMIIRIHEQVKLAETAKFRNTISCFDHSGLVSNLTKKLKDGMDQCLRSLARKNDDESMQFNLKLMSKVEENFLNNLDESQNLTCQILRDSEISCLSEYCRLAKGPKARQVKEDTEMDRDHKIRNMRTILLENAESQSLELFKNGLENVPIHEKNPSKIKDELRKKSLNYYEKVVCKDVNCNMCLGSRLRLSKNFDDTFESWWSRRPKQLCFQLWDPFVLVSLIVVIILSVLIVVIIGRDE